MKYLASIITLLFVFSTANAQFIEAGGWKDGFDGATFGASFALSDNLDFTYQAGVYGGRQEAEAKFLTSKVGIEADLAKPSTPILGVDGGFLLGKQGSINFGGQARIYGGWKYNAVSVFTSYNLYKFGYHNFYWNPISVRVNL